MPTTSYPYNVVITRDPLVLNKIFFDKVGRTSFSDAFSRLNASEKEKALIVSPRSNNNFISLDVNFPTQQSSQGTKYVVLKLLETSKLLEYFNISTEGFTELMISRAIVKKAALGSDKVLDDLAQEIRPRFFLSFGVGDDIREWSGPYSLSLIDVNISITSDGVRELELMLTPTTEAMTVFSNKLYDDYQYAQADSVFDTAANKNVIIRTSRKYDLKEGKFTELTKKQAAEKTAENRRRGVNQVVTPFKVVLPGHEPATQPSKDWNYCVRNILHAFIADRFPSVPRGNVLVLLPDDFNDYLNVGGHPKDLIDNKYKEPLESFGIDISLDYDAQDDVGRSRQVKKNREGIAAEFATAKIKKLKLLAKDKSKTEAIIERQSSEIRAINTRIAEIEDIPDSPADRRVIREWKTIKNKCDEIDKFNLASPGQDATLQKIVICKRLRNGYYWERALEEAYKVYPSARTGTLTVRLPIMTIALANFLSKPPVPGGKASTNNTEKNELIKRREDLVDSIEMVEDMLEDASNKASIDNRVNELHKQALIFAQQFRYNPDLNEKDGLDLENFKQFILSMGGAVDTKALEEKNTLLTLQPIYKFIEGVYGVSGQVLPRDFTIIEENDAKILKLLEDSRIIEDADSPVVFFGRLDSIRNWVYPSNTVALDSAPFTDNWQRQASPRLWKLTEKQGDLQGGKQPAIRSPIKFFWGKYIPAFIAAFKPKAGFKTSSFGEGVGIYYDAIKELADAANTDNPLIFTHNIKNSNVLSLSFDSSPYKGELLNYSTESLYKIVDGVFKPGELLADDVFHTGALGKLIAMAAQSVLFRPEGTSKILAIQKALSTSAAGVQIKLINEKERGAINAETFYDSVIIKAAGSSSIKQEGTMGNNSINEAETLKKMNKYIINVDIKTLPFFNTFVIPGRKCVLLGKPNLIRGASELRGKIETVPAFFTNAYTIIGYKHRITSTDAYSEFKLIQDAYSEGVMMKNMSFSDAFAKQIKKALELLKGQILPSDEMLIDYLKDNVIIGDPEKQN
jgi:hypothetical protein